MPDERRDGRACAAWSHKLQHRYGEPLFRKALLKELKFKLGQIGFEEILITIDVPLMSAQTGNSFTHIGPRRK
jgi:hypothetical protein